MREPRSRRTSSSLFAADYSDFEQEINTLRTHQGQSDVYVINDANAILKSPSPTLGPAESTYEQRYDPGAAAAEQRRIAREAECACWSASRRLA